MISQNPIDIKLCRDNDDHYNFYWLIIHHFRLLIYYKLYEIITITSSIYLYR